MYIHARVHLSDLRILIVTQCECAFRWIKIWVRIVFTDSIRDFVSLHFVTILFVTIDFSRKIGIEWNKSSLGIRIPIKWDMCEKMGQFSQLESFSSPIYILGTHQMIFFVKTLLISDRQVYNISLEMSQLVSWVFLTILVNICRMKYVSGQGTDHKWLAIKNIVTDLAVFNDPSCFHNQQSIESCTYLSGAVA